jgi:hypothetical protein
MSYDDEELELAELGEEERKRREARLRGLMEDVLADGYALITRSKLLQLFQAQRLRVGRWEDMKDQFAAIGGTPAELRGRFLPNDLLLITRFPIAKNPLSED